jgi:small-conductance mechanosensitive channel
MILGSSIVSRAAESLGQSLPRIGGALVLLVLGLIVARLAGRIVRRVLQALEVDKLAERYKVNDVLARAGLPRSLAHLLGRAVRIALMVVVVVASVSLLGFAALSSSLNEAVLFLPRLFAAVALIVIGFVFADLVRDRVDHHSERMALGGPLGQIAYVTVLAVFVLTAASQLHVPTGVLTILGTVLIGAAAFSIGLAFGLGGRDVARELSAATYVATSIRIGQAISVDGVSGEVIALERTAVVLRATDGTNTRVPNHLLLTSTVTVADGPPSATSA